MKKIIKLQADVNKVYINLNTLRYCTHPIYINADFESNWVQVEEKDVRSFIAEQKAQKEAEKTIKEE